MQDRIIRKIYFLIIFFIQSICFAQNYPNYFFDLKSLKIKYDCGINWSSLTGYTTMQSHIIPNFEQANPNFLFTKGRLGVHISNNNKMPYAYGKFSFKKYFFSYINPAIINDINIPIDQSNISNTVISNSFDLNNMSSSGIGFRNNWVLIQIGRDRESWGAGDDIQIALSEYSNAYNYFLLASDYGRIRVRYIHGFLEKIEGVNRYLNARGIEWTNKKSIILGFSEFIIYSGFNRPFDIGYVNPIATHLEVELNDRLNTVGTNSGNGGWQVHFDWLIKNKLRLSINYFIDEFVLDPDIEIGKRQGSAYSVRLAYTPYRSSVNILNIFSSFVMVGPTVYRHLLGENNFVQGGKPLGWHNGSDGWEVKVGSNFLKINNLIVSMSGGIFQTGEESISNKIFEPVNEDILFDNNSTTTALIRINFVDVSIQWMLKQNIFISSRVTWQKFDNSSSREKIKLSLALDVFLPFTYNFVD